MIVLLVPVGKEPVPIKIGNDLKSLQDAVDGNIESYKPFRRDVPVTCIVNEEGALNGSKHNRTVYRLGPTGDAIDYDMIFGDFLIVGTSEDEIVSLTPEQLRQFAEMFRYKSVYVEW